MVRIAVILGSTRPNRNGEAVAKWVHEACSKRSDAAFELVDVAEQHLPLLDEPAPPSQDHYQKEHTVRWAKVVEGFDGFVFVTAEYNHGVPAALKNAIDFLYKEWNNKAAGFVSYGSAGGVRAVEHLRDVMAEVQVATVRSQVMFTLREDFEDYTQFKPRSFHAKTLEAMLDQLVPWTKAMAQVRQAATPSAAPRETEERRETSRRPARPAAGQQRQSTGPTA